MNLDKKGIFRKILVGLGIVIIIYILYLFSIWNNKQIQKCIDAGHSEAYCVEGLN